jgi:6,7-dimethyl-8-ribityllumazine synthase
MEGIRHLEAKMEASGLKIALVATRFNNFVVEHLVAGAVDYLTRHGAARQDLTVVRIPGAFEMPLVCKRLAASGKYDGIVALGAVIRGETAHFDLVAAEVAKGIAHVTLDTGVPIGFGVLATDNLEQAIERAGSKAGNHGAQAASAMLETVRVLEQL